MKFNQYFYIIWLQLLLIANVLSISFYAITAPGLLKSNRKYTVAVTLDHVEEQCTIRVSIEGYSFNASHNVQLNAYETKLLNFYPPQLLGEKYKLIAEGIKGLKFRNETDLLIERDAGPNIFIQTDKENYKSEDLVQFRVVILDEHTRPLKISEPIRIDILDPQENRVKQFKDIKLVKGVFTGKFQLSQRPVMGTWEIKVKVTGRYSFERVKWIKVRKYALPKFSVHIETAKDILLEDEKTKALIYGKYTFGRYVEGIANIQLWEGTNPGTLVKEEIMQIKGPKPIDITWNSLRNSTTDFHFLHIVVRMTDIYTGTQRSNDVFINVHKTRYAIKISDTEVEFNNGVPYLLKAYVSHRTGLPVLDHQTPVILKHGNKTYETFLEGKGVATFMFQYESGQMFAVVYKDSQLIMKDFFKHSVTFNESETYCKLRLLKEKPRFFVPVEIEVSSISNIPYLAYVLVGHGNIVRMQHIPLEPFQKSYIIRLTPNVEMVPDSHLYVFYIDNGQLRSNEIKISLPNEFENKIAIVAPKDVEPGQTVTFDLIAQPTNSYVSILAVDISVYLNNPSYDLDKENILADLKRDKSYVKVKNDIIYPGISSGLIIMSNAYFPLLSYVVERSINPTSGRDFNYRKLFPETWIFQNVEVNSTTTRLTFKVPDTITTWRITAFSINEECGFGITDKPVNIISRKQFFITTNLPYSVKLGEIVNIPITVFNYMAKSVKSEITLYNDKDEFKFIDESLSEIGTSEQSKNVNVNTGSGENVTFRIKPIKSGHISLRLTALTDTATDAIIQKLKVEAGGVLKSFNEARYLKVETNETLTTNFSIDFPTNIISDSEYVKLEIGGNYLKSSFENLHNLVKKPTGCGEQNMVNFAPSILILQLLKATGKYSELNPLVIKLKSYIEIGYQQQLAYRHDTGGYSVFGQAHDEEESTWLTAYVLKFFIKATRYSKIENRIIETGLGYLSKQQLKDGSFPYTGYLFTPAQENVYGVTAFVLLAFLERSRYSEKYSATINNALRFLHTHIDNIDDIYSLAIIATALTAAKSQEATKLLEKLNQVSNTDANGNKWWSVSKENYDNDIEITSYILMALLETRGDYRHIVKWLIEHRNEFGGYMSTHNTVVGLQALIKYYEQFQTTNDTRITLKYTAKNKIGDIVDKGGFEVTPDNFDDLQMKELPKSVNQVILEVTGFGYVLVHLNHQYNILNETLAYSNPAMKSRFTDTMPIGGLTVSQKLQQFLIEPHARLTNSILLDLKICFMYQSPADQHIRSTNMIILEVNLPSGFRSNAENSEDLMDNDRIERIESKNYDTTILLYIDSLTVNQTECVNIDGEKVNDVFDIQPVAIKMYDYYDDRRSETVFYTIDTNR